MPRFLNIDAARALRILAAVAVMFAFYFAREVLIPTALAILLTFLIFPMVRRVQRWGLPRGVAVAVSVGAVLLLTLAIAGIVFRQAVDLTARFPDYKENLRTKIRDVRGSTNGTLSRLSGTLHDLKQELAASQPTTATAGTGAGDRQPAPVKVELIDSEDVGEIASRLAGPLIYPLTQAGITLLMLVFLLVYTEDVRERAIWLAGMRQMSVTTAALDESGERIGRYLRMQLLVNTTFGALLAIGFFVAGLPGALMWGVIAGILRFIPFVGPWLGAALPAVLAIAVSPHWTTPIAVIGWVVVVELFENMVMEPWLYDASTGMSSVGVVFAMVFWAWLWGPVGFILAVPMTVCLVVLGKHIPQLAIFNQLFGTEGAIPEVARLYQRLLIGDETAAEEIVDAHLKDSALLKVADDLLLPALCELKRDFAAGLIGREQTREALRTLELILPGDVPTTPAAESSARDDCPRLLCVPGPGIIEEAAARLLARTAMSESIPAEALGYHSLANDVASRAAACDAASVCIVQIAPVAKTYARHLVKTLAARLRDAEQLQFVEMLVEAPCMPEPRPDSHPPSEVPRPAPSTTTPATGEPSVLRVNSFKELIGRLSDLRKPTSAPGHAAKSQTEPATA